MVPVITSFDVARLAGVSQPTVSRALRDSDKVSEKTKAGFARPRRLSGYAPNAIGRALALGHSTRVGLVVTDLHNHFYGHVIPHLHSELSRQGTSWSCHRGARRRRPSPSRSSPTASPVWS